MMGDSFIVCMLPARNEEGRVGTVVDSFRKALSGTGGRYEVVVVDDASNDGTGDEARRAGARVLRHDNHAGLASAFRTGVSYADSIGATCFVHADADGQHTAEELTGLLARWRTKGGLVIGNRLTSRPESMSLLRYEWNMLLSSTIAAMCALPVPDSQSGYRVFSKEVANLNIQADFTYTQEQILRAANKGHSVSFVPIKAVARRNSSSRIASDPLTYLSRALPDIQKASRDMGIANSW